MNNGNDKDLLASILKGELMGIVDEECGGIIAYTLPSGSKIAGILQGIVELTSLLREKRSDISDALHRLLENGELDTSLIEHRFISAKIPDEGITVYYDTLTTLLSYDTPSGQVFECENHEYADN